MGYYGVSPSASDDRIRIESIDLGDYLIYDGKAPFSPVQEVRVVLRHTGVVQVRRESRLRRPFGGACVSETVDV
jgi:hypothetical protein